METNDNSLTGKIRSWFERTPRAQRAYEKLSADLDSVVEQIDSATVGLRERIGPIIDPPASRPASAQPPTVAASDAAGLGNAAQPPDPVFPSSESSVPPGVKRDGAPIDPTT